MDAIGFPRGLRIMPHSPRTGRKILATFIAGLFAFCFTNVESHSADAPPVTSPCSKPLPEQLFSRWPQGKKPDVVLFLSGEQHSYLKFCGCSNPQFGGFERRYNLLMKLKEKGWPVVPL